MNTSKRLLLLVAASWLLSGCDRTPQATGTSDDTHSSIDISGRVFNERSEPLGAVVVHLRHANLSDTTDGDGKFAVHGDLAKIPANVRNETDTLDYLRDGALVHSTPIATWIDTLPDLFLVQRDISGDIENGNILIGAVAATIWNGRGDTLRIPLEWNPATNHYSAFAWFRYAGTVDSFQLVVKTYDDSGRALGASAIQAFTSRAGDLLVPKFDASNLLPVISSRHSNAISNPGAMDSFLRRDSLRLGFKVKDPAGNRLSYLWQIESGEWKDGTPDTTIYVWQDAPDTLHVRFKVVRSDGVVVRDSFRFRLSVPAPSCGFEMDIPKHQGPLLHSPKSPGEVYSTYRFAKMETLIPIHFIDHPLPDAAITTRRIRWTYLGDIGSNGVVQDEEWVDVSGKDTVLSPKLHSRGTYALTYHVCDTFHSCGEYSGELIELLGSPVINLSLSIGSGDSLSATWGFAGYINGLGGPWTISLLDSTDRTLREMSVNNFLPSFSLDSASWAGASRIRFANRFTADSSDTLILDTIVTIPKSVPAVKAPSLEATGAASPFAKLDSAPFRDSCTPLAARCRRPETHDQASPQTSILS